MALIKKDYTTYTNRNIYYSKKGLCLNNKVMQECDIEEDDDINKEDDINNKKLIEANLEAKLEAKHEPTYEHIEKIQGKNIIKRTYPKPEIMLSKPLNQTNDERYFYNLEKIRQIIAKVLPSNDNTSKNYVRFDNSDNSNDFDISDFSDLPTQSENQNHNQNHNQNQSKNNKNYIDEYGENENKHENEIIEILLLVNTELYEIFSSISDNRIKFLKYLTNHFPNMIVISKNLTNDVYKKYPNLKIIITYVLGQGAGPIHEQVLFKNLTKQPTIKYGIWIEDCQYVDFVGKYCMFCDFIILNIKHKHFAKKYLEKNSKLHMYNMEHFIDTNIFTDYQLTKQYDILFYGYVNNVYLFRSRLLKLLMAHKHLFKLKVIKHPGYFSGTDPEVRKKNKSITGKNLSKLLNKSYLSICTKSNHDMMLKKYVETSFSMCMPCGDIPTDYQHVLGNIVNITEHMSDKEIITTIINALNDKKELTERTIRLRKILMDKYSYKKSIDKFKNIVEHIKKL